MKNNNFKKICVAIISMLFILTTYGSICIAEEPILEENLIDLSSEELEQINELLLNLEEGETKRIVQDIIDQVVTPDGQLDIEQARVVMQEQYDSISLMVAPDSMDEEILSYYEQANMDSPTFPLEQNMNEMGSIGFIDIPSSPTPTGTSTEFNPPYHDEYGWEDEYLVSYAAHGENRYSGAVASYTGAWTGASVAESFQVIQFYVGRTKTISIQGVIDSYGGKLIFPPAAVAGTEITCMVDWDPDLYFRSDIDPPFDFDWFKGVLFYFVGMLGVYFGQDVQDAIRAIRLANDAMEFADLLLTISEVETHTITGSFTATPGYHTVAVGLRAQAVGVAIGTAHGGRVGQVKKIVIEGIAPPTKPTINGPRYSKPGTSVQFTAVSTDPNGDNIQYKFDWGDGDVSSWTSFYSSGTSVTKSHTYQDTGDFIIKVKARDNDNIESDWKTYTITIGYPSITLTPSNYNFGNVKKGTCSSAYSFTLKNTGQIPAQGSVYISGTDSGHFVISSGGGSFNIDPSQTKTIKVKFCPTTLGSKSATLKADASNCGNDQSTLSGYGRLTNDSDSSDDSSDPIPDQTEMEQEQQIV